MIKRSDPILEFKIPELNKYEMVLLIARRARQINAARVNLQKRHNTP